jgi:hypothetical protein
VRGKTASPVLLARHAQGFGGFHAGSAKIAQVVLVNAPLVRVGGPLIVRGAGFVLVRRGLVCIRRSLVRVRRSLIRIRIGPRGIARATGRRLAASIRLRFAYAHLKNQTPRRCHRVPTTA